MSKIASLRAVARGTTPALATPLAAATRHFSTGKKVKMTTEEAFVKLLQKRGIDNAFGIIGSAFMPISDWFPAAGIKYWDCAHEYTGGFMADGYTRATGKMSMMIAQNGR